MNIYVGNLSRLLKEEELKELFQTYGEVTTVNIIKDKFTGESRGFAFVEMTSSEEAETAITELNGKDVQGRTINVNQAKPRTEGGSHGGGRMGGRGGSRGGFGGGFGGRREDRGGFGGGRGRY